MDRREEASEGGLWYGGSIVVHDGRVEQLGFYLSEFGLEGLLDCM